MKKMFFIALAVGLSLTAVSAATGPAGTRPEFSVKIIPTKAVNLENQFSGILPNRPPFIPQVVKVTCGEPFELAVVFSGAKISDGKLKLSGKLTTFDAKGQTKEFPLSCDYSPQSGFRKCCLTLLKKKTGRFEAVIQICHCGIVQNLFVRKKSCLN